MTPVSAIAQSGLAAATLRLNVSASNLANVGDVSSVGASGGYQPQGVAQAAAPTGGVFAQAVSLSPAQMLAFEPTSPLANAQGLVQTPDIAPISEIANQLQAGQAFAVSLKALQTANEEQQSLLDIQT